MPPAAASTAAACWLRGALAALPGCALAAVLAAAPALAQQAPRADPPLVDPPRPGIAKAWGERLADFAATSDGERRTAPRDGSDAPSAADLVCRDSLPVLLADAERNDAVAAFRVGAIYEEGCGVRPNRQAAARYYEKAAKIGHVDAQVRLGVFYVEGEVVEADYARARALLAEPAAKGHPLASYHLGVMAWRGDDTHPPTPDREAAMRHFRAAAENGLAQAQFIVGQALVQGAELPRDLEAAAAMLDRAARQGNVWSMVILGRLHAERELSGADAGVALKWLTIAREASPDDAMLQASVGLSLQRLEGRLSAVQRRQALAQARSFAPKPEWEEKF